MSPTLSQFGVAALFVVGGCSGPTLDSPAPHSAQSSASAAIQVELTMDVVVNANGSVSVTAESNLPDGTELGGSVFKEGAFTAQDPGVLEDGAAEFGPFSDKGARLPAGTYNVSVTMPIARNQPGDVRAIIGEHGENLAGIHVSNEDITGDAVVATSESLVIP